MADCKACGAWFGTSTPQDLCPTCERAMKRLNGYALHVVRCKDCRNWVEHEFNSDVHQCALHYGLQGIVYGEDFCSFGEKMDAEVE